MSEVCDDWLEVSWKHSSRAWSEHSSGRCPGNPGPDYAPPLLHSQCCEELKFSQNTAAVITSLCTVRVHCADCGLETFSAAQSSVVSGKVQ